MEVHVEVKKKIPFQKTTHLTKILEQLQIANYKQEFFSINLSMVQSLLLSNNQVD